MGIKKKIMSTWIPIITGFVGVLVGSIVPVIMQLIQLKANTRRDKTKLACELAMADRQSAIAISMDNLGRGGKKKYAIYPLSVYIHFHMKLLKAMDKGKLNEKMLIDLARRSIEFGDLFEIVTGRVDGKLINWNKNKRNKK